MDITKALSVCVLKMSFRVKYKAPQATTHRKEKMVHLQSQHVSTTFRF